MQAIGVTCFPTAQIDVHFALLFNPQLRTISADHSGQIPANVLRPSHSAKKMIAAAC
jgi:hypothetical protein